MPQIFTSQFDFTPSFLERSQPLQVDSPSSSGTFHFFALKEEQETIMRGRLVIGIRWSVVTGFSSLVATLKVHESKGCPPRMFVVPITLHNVALTTPNETVLNPNLVATNKLYTLSLSIVAEPLLGVVRGASRRTSMSRVTPLLHSRHPNDVRIYFSREGRELWANSTMLKKASSYLEKQLESDFAEGQVSAVLTRERSPAVALAFEDSDDEEEAATATKATDDKLACDHPFHNIAVTQATYRTYKALLLYISTGKIDFAPLSSSFHEDSAGPKSSEETLSEAEASSNDAPIPDDERRFDLPSPKSIYRLAHLLEMEDLCTIALGNVNAQLSPSYVMREVVSDVAQAYQPFRKVVVDFAVAHWSSVKQTDAFKELKQQAEEGTMVQASVAIYEIMERLS